MMSTSLPSFWSQLPEIKGTYTPFAPLAPLTWFKTGGPADVLYEPKDLEDLQYFLTTCPQDIPITVLGKCSNTLIRDKGIAGVVIKLGDSFNTTHVYEDTKIKAGAGTFDAVIAKVAMTHGIGGMEFLSGIPGSLGGAVIMNAGAYGTEIKDILVSVSYLTRQGELITKDSSSLTFSYRHTHLPQDIIIVEAILQGTPDTPERIKQKIDDIRTKRRETQPIKDKTGGSTFRNPLPSHINNQPVTHAWQVVDACQLRGYNIGDAMFSDKHCNFLINKGHATASDLEALGDLAIARAKEQFNIDLIWEIKRIGRAS